MMADEIATRKRFDSEEDNKNDDDVSI